MNANSHAKFKFLIEKYIIFNNFRFEKLTTLEEQVYYLRFLEGKENTSTAIP